MDYTEKTGIITIERITRGVSDTYSLINLFHPLNRFNRYDNRFNHFNSFPYMTVEKTIPVFRIFDYQKAVEFYVDWLGFEIVWNHYFEENMPVYMEVTKGGLTLHLSEHHGDATPGAKVFVWCTGLKEYHKILINKHYKNNRPGFEETFYGAWCVEVIDPFGNRISFNEKKAEYGSKSTSE